MPYTSIFSIYTPEDTVEVLLEINGKESGKDFIQF